jgi:putative copper export protein
MTDFAWLALRAAGLVLALQAAGAAFFVAALSGPLARSAARIRAASARVAALSLLLLAAQYGIEPAHLAGDWSGIADPALQRLLLSSPLAAALGLRLAGSAAIAVGLWLKSRWGGGAALAGALAVLGSFGLTGHTTQAGHRLLLAPLLLVHLCAAAFWFGSLLPLREVCAREPYPVAARTLEAFSAAALWLVPLIPAAGIALATLLLPDLTALLAPYGLLLIAKAALFAALMGLAAINRLRLTPALTQADPRAPARLRRTIAAEYLIICAVLAVSAVMTGLFSPASAAAAALSESR